ncbi:MAG: bifunctional folylpolyglutamate synthase/dihydrofolate synthase [Candidatus Bipolaricaulota bacterium]|nr:bifunctional folylpolyglutamate synthase/dihydrofolate synthase [Candidatus Bipolaricaulota bacterium]MDW8031653.1 folylpolyglutamate synthase/dihydrofolate synthase family protein [Candidatus Bipolaricaulota bacterium]
MDQAIAYLNRLPHTEVKPGLTRIRALLEAVGNPHAQFRAVHIAGTNGKGSVAAMLASVLQCAGYRVGLYTSPHLISHCERIQINQTPITEAEFVQLADELIPIADSMIDTPTQFEFLTAMAFLSFARHKIDIAVIEVGIGGRFDATNVITPSVSVLTNVGLDHTDLLGNTVEQIAWEKAGIAKQGVPFVTGEQKQEALRVIERECATVGAPLIRARQRARRSDFTWEYQEFQLESGQRLRLQLLGGYQQENLNIVLEALDVLQRSLRLPEEAVREGLEQARWPGRFEVVQREPFVMVLDGAHNPPAIQALRDDLRRYREKYSLTKCTLLFGVLKDKDYSTMAQTLFPDFQEIILVKPDSPRALEPEVLRRWAPSSKIYPDLATSLAAARKTRPDLLCVTGSLYLVGAVKRFL